MTSAGSSVSDIWSKLQSHYWQTTTQQLRVLDSFLAFTALTGVAQVVYCGLVGSFPFNSFLAGIMCSVGVFVLTVSLRLHLAPSGDGVAALRRDSVKNAFAEYVFCNMILFLAVMNFMG
ncbi:putative dolichyl-diphosphooligosaccharide-protein glycosyltransferase subunit [Tribonema minus]|uniref:Dolichyl-diphosphooligosaccharide--protein glycosyltransferase subunit OST2 n=1 Tax=Tribonema minus TaxID=303371 RepID=A0A835YRC1_9STRA|nr:putative dolichyl-diphosphooligosaccharide-protein glycosyltransferase subunit [Tribonema minus]